jgi:hypothetical protein
LTYTPSTDRILPSPSHLHVKIKNTSAIPLRAAYLHGPYTLYVACYPTTFDPNRKHETHRTEGTPQFEPNLKAGGHWNAKLTVPEDVRQTAGGFAAGATTKKGRESFTWIIEIASQVIFSTSAAVHFEVLVGRDEKSVELGFGALTGSGGATPGQIHDHPLGKKSKHLGRSATEAKGIYSRAVDLMVDDTGSLWNTPEFPSWDDEAEYPYPGEQDNLRPVTSNKPAADATARKSPRKRKRVHLVVLTHGLHSNLGADMLYLKESIDKAAAQAKLDARRKRPEFRAKEAQKKTSQDEEGTSEAQSSGDQPPDDPGALKVKDQDLDTDDEEQVIVRGFSGNTVRTERGIQYLGKRLAKYVLHMTYPDQPYLPTKKSAVKSISRTFTGQSKASDDSAGPPVHAHSSIHRDDHKEQREKDAENTPYKITSISFISHSLGGLIQTYAIAYIQKHSPEFFDNIRPINFVAMASPFLGLSNENPIYVKFALDFGLVGRTGQDLGLTWRTPTMVRSGWASMIGGLGTDAAKAQKQPDPGSKPLLRILPSGPAHQVLKKFRNRTVYSNVVNDGIVPLRTSCLLFLDWRGLGRVEKARRENGLVGTMAGWGWAELTGANSSSPKLHMTHTESGDESGSEGRNTPTTAGHGDTVPQPSENETNDDNDARSLKSPGDELHSSQFLNPNDARRKSSANSNLNGTSPTQLSPLSSLISFFKPQASASQSSKPSQAQHLSKNKAKIYKRSQTVRISSRDTSPSNSTDTPAPTDSNTTDTQPTRPPRVRGDSLYGEEDVHAPPKTTFFESAGDLLAPPLPPDEFLIDPSSRPRTIFHDRVYHPSDIPPPPVKRARTGMLSRSISNNSVPKSTSSASTASQLPSITRSTSHERPTTTSPIPTPEIDTSPMKVEEKIARAYHHDLSWRKVLVRLEPDAHNNMVVRRMFANAYGWPVIKHLVDTHFAYTIAAETEDSAEADDERARPMVEPPTKHGEEVRDQTRKPSNLVVEFEDSPHERRSQSEARDMSDSVPEMLISPTFPTSPISTHTVTAPRTPHSKQSSTSSKASVSFSLSRQESGRWSDRYFETDSESSDEEKLDPRTGVISSPTKTRLRRAFGGRSTVTTAAGSGTGSKGGDAAGNGSDEVEIPHDDDNEVVQPGTSEAEIEDFLRSATPTASKPPELEPEPMGGEGDTQKDAVEAEAEEVVKSGTTEDLPFPPLGTSAIGLGKKVDEEVAGLTLRPPADESGGGDGHEERDKEQQRGEGTLKKKRSVSETVARLSATG